VIRGSQFAAIALVVFTLPAAPAHAMDEVAAYNYPDVLHRLGRRTVDVLANADRGEIVRVDPNPIDRSVRGKALPPNVGGYPIVGQSRALDPRLIEGFRKVLLDLKTYDISPPGIGVSKLCGPIQPGVAVRFWSKADKDHRSPTEILLCFRCGDLQVVAPKARPWSMSPGEGSLLRLAAAGLPEYTELAEMLASRGEASARTRLFDSLFPPEIQLDLQADDKNGGTVEARAARLRTRVSGPELFRLAARALALRDKDWDRTDDRTKIVVDAIKQLTADELRAGLQAIRGDQLALAGAGELMSYGAADRLKEEERIGWLPVVAEAALVQQGNAPRCTLVQSVAAAGARAVPLLAKVRRGEIVFANTSTPRSASDADPSPAACAMLALVRADRAKAAAELRVWRPADPRDAAVARIVRAQLGDGDAADPVLFRTKSTVVALATLDTYQMRPSAAAVEVLVEEAVGHGSHVVRERAAALFKMLSAVDLEPVIAPAERTKVARAWWQQHRVTWKPPTAPAR
jgi:hypothetical protein